jgi:hypothetical protein
MASGGRGRIRCLIRDIDFRDRVDRRLGLSMKPLDGDRAKSEACEHC